MAKEKFAKLILTLLHKKEKSLTISREDSLTTNFIPSSDKRDSSKWFHKVSAKLPWTVHLVPFLLSMGNGLEVISPLRLRDHVLQMLVSSIEKYMTSESTDS